MAVEILRISWIDMGVGSSSFVGVLAVATSDLSGSDKSEFEGLSFRF